jgi:hypothetical protein
MLTKTSVRELFESHCGSDPRRFGATVCHMLGLTGRDGRRNTDAAGNYRLRPAANGDRLRTSEVSLRALAEALLGEDAIERHLRPNAIRDLVETRDVLEGTGAGAVMPSGFANINAFTAATAGLLEAMVLEAYENPAFVGDVLAPVEPSKQFEGRKTIGVARIGDLAEERLPGMPTKRVQVGERWLVQPRTVENALSCEVTQEAVYLDLTGGQLAEHTGATGLGEWLGYRKELRIIDSFIGVVNSFNYKGTNYTTYVAAGTLYDNYISSGNELLHEDSVQNVLIKFRDMTDPETGTRVMIQPNTVLVNREKVRTANAVLGPTAQGFQFRDAPGATTGTQEITISDPAYKGQFRIIESPLVYERCDAASGLNLSADASAKAWWVFESGSKTHVYVQNWPMRTQSAAPNQVDMIDRGVVLYTKADERGVPMWKDPRRSVQSRA